jgi:hypothetical protein
MTPKDQRTPPEREIWLKSFEQALVRIYGRDGFPRALVGDLDDLLFTLEDTASILRALAMATNLDRKELDLHLYHIQIAIEEDLPMIFRDLLPAMKRLRDDK